MTRIKTADLLRRRFLRKDIVPVTPGESKQSFFSLMKWAIKLAAPYKKWGFIILMAMLIETVASLATPWPLKVIIDNVVAGRALPKWLSWMEFTRQHESQFQLATIAAIFFVVISVIGSLAGYLENYYNES